MFKYLWIFEDGEVKGGIKEPIEDDLANVDDGILQIIRLSDQTTYLQGEWHNLLSVDEIEN